MYVILSEDELSSTKRRISRFFAAAQNDEKMSIMTKKEKELTICFVYHSTDTKRLMELNMWFIRRMNPDIECAWVVTDNSLGAVPYNQEGITVVPGSERPKKVPSWVKGSYHHAAGMNKQLPFIQTRYALFLENDFFIVRRNWIQDTCSHMKEYGLSFFGAPDHPSLFTKCRYFPGISCLFIDCTRVDIKNFDFSPDYDFSSRRMRRLLKKIGYDILGNRFLIGTSRDTMYKIYNRCYRNTTFFHECVQPVFQRQSAFVERLLPDRFSFVPKKAGYVSKTSFHDLGYFNAADQGWEEYVWREAPFGFHTKGFDNYLKKDLFAENTVIEDALNDFATRITSF